MKKFQTSARSAFKAGILVIGFAIIAGATAARPALRNVEHITEGLIDTAIAYEIGNQCDSIAARWLRGINFLHSLEAHARELGYSNDEVSAFIDDRNEKHRLEGIARDRLADLGAVDGVAASYCAAGRTQIALGSQIGLLLR
ncbi:MAG: DUF5333 domain-containing protein [Rhodobacteraceae bacterium]|nr:DUF5333 domain-containing protein [Paracoccaceae bacterium]